MNGPRYLNLDLVISSFEDLTPLMESFGDQIDLLYNGKENGIYRAICEIAGRNLGAEQAALAFCQLIEGLEGKALQLWQGAFSRDFDFGFESGQGSHQLRIRFEPALIGRIALCGASISITLYPADQPSITPTA
jgi:hypothetical protein